MNCIHCDAATRVLETRKAFEGYVTRRERECGGLTPGTPRHRFSTYEVDESLSGTVVRIATRNKRIEQLVQRAKRARRNLVIAQSLRAGEKHAVLAERHHLAPNMISTIARQHGIPSLRARSNRSSHAAAQE